MLQGGSSICACMPVCTGSVGLGGGGHRTHSAFGTASCWSGHSFGFVSVLFLVEGGTSGKMSLWQMLLQHHKSFLIYSACAVQGGVILLPQMFPLKWFRQLNSARKDGKVETLDRHLEMLGQEVWTVQSFAGLWAARLELVRLKHTHTHKPPNMRAPLPGLDIRFVFRLPNGLSHRLENGSINSER